MPKSVAKGFAWPPAPPAGGAPNKLANGFCAPAAPVFCACCSSPVAPPVCGVVSVTPGAGNADAPPPPKARSISSCIRIIRGSNKMRRKLGSRSICRAIGLFRIAGDCSMICWKAGLFIISFIVCTKFGSSIKRISSSGFGGAPICLLVRKLKTCAKIDSNLRRHPLRKPTRSARRESQHNALRSERPVGCCRCQPPCLWGRSPPEQPRFPPSNLNLGLQGFAARCSRHL